MDWVKENLIGLLSFLPILLGLFLPFKSKPIEPQFKMPESPGQLNSKDSKYDALIGPSEPLLPTEPVFCPKCHVLAANIRRTKEGIQIVQNNKALVTIGANVIIRRAGKAKTGFPIRCPNGHTVEVQ